jgi:hypothetical protein
VGLEPAEVEATVAAAAGLDGEQRGETTRVFFEELDAEELDVAADALGSGRGGPQAHRGAPAAVDSADTAGKSYTLESYRNT